MKVVALVLPWVHNTEMAIIYVYDYLEAVLLGLKRIFGIW